MPIPSLVSRRSVALIVGVLALWTAPAAQPSAERDWPVATREAKPWTRWWWHGSAVDRGELTKELEALNAAGIGGVEITPIYGVRGEEKHFIQFLSEDWLRMLDHTLREAARLDVGVDMATGTGWPFGGPWVVDDFAPRSIAHKTWTLTAGQRITEPIRLRQTPLVRAPGNQIHVVNEGAPGDPPRAPGQQPLMKPGVQPIQIADLVEPVTANRDLQTLALEQVKYPRDLPLGAVIAYDGDGAVLDLTSRVTADRMLDWSPASGKWTVYAVFPGWHGKMVERAAPGGEGFVIDHFSRNAIRSYLARFDRAFGPVGPQGLRAFFNDSYEVDDASGQGDWTPLLFDEFQKRRGYDLRRHLPALFGRDTEAENTRVLVDYRETISDLLLDTFTREWGAWARNRGRIIRNQAHGSPANLLDLYAASDIPETEGTDIPRFKWAVSAANVAGRRLVSAEAATWLGEHFRSTLADVRSAVDFLLAAGVNHIVYHGTAYSPDRDPWPGWQFYASVEFNPQNAWWDDFGTLNRYVTRAQSFLQSGRADHDVLLYFPFRDALAARGNAMLTHFGGANRATAAASFEAIRSTLQSRGYTYDYVSDRQLRNTVAKDGRLTTEGGGSYAVLVVPATRFMPAATRERIAALERGGARIVHVPDRADVEPLLARVGVAREPIADMGVLFARRDDAQGRFYFLVNPSEKPVEGYVPLNIGSSAATLFDPMTGRRGRALVRNARGGALEVYLQLPPGESLIVAAAAEPAQDRFDIHRSAGPSAGIGGTPWSVRFVKGGSVLPAARTIDPLASWTTFPGDEHRSFSGTAVYATTFQRPEGKAEAWRLDLGRVHESARLRLNGRNLGTLIGPRFEAVIDPAMLRATNTLEVSVTNLSANRIADADRRGVPWKKFYNVNMPARLPENRGADGLFTATKWEPLPSGLLGPVTLTPLERVR